MILLSEYFWRYVNIWLRKWEYVVKSVLSKIVNHDGEMFGAVRKECGNYRNLDLSAAKRECARYLDVLNNKENDFLYKGDKI